MPGLKGSHGTSDTSGNDIINGFIDLDSSSLPTTATTFNGYDQINGGGGTNIFKLAISGDSSSNYSASLSNVEKVQIVEINNTTTGGKVSVDTSANADVTDLKVTKSTSEIALTAANTQNVSVAAATDDIAILGGKNVTVTNAGGTNDIAIGDGTDDPAGVITVTATGQGAGDIDIDGGTDVNVTVTSKKSTVTGDIEIGTNKAASGAVKVVQNLSDDGTGLDNSTKSIEVTGGKTVDVTINANSTATAAAKDGLLKIGTTTVTSDGKTTDVTITQNATVNNFAKVDNVIVKEKDTVTFKAMTTGQTLTASDGTVTLIFKAAKNLTAEQVAAAFSNLIKGDTQSAGGPTANGFYSGTFSNTTGALWTSAAASGNTVVFTAVDEAQTNIVWGGTAALPTVVNTAGSKTLGSAKTTNAVNLGTVSVTDDATASIKTITANGYDTGSTTGTSVLETLNLSNGKGFTVASSAATLALNLEKVNGAISLTAAPKTLNLQSIGDNTSTLTAAATEALNVSGTGVLTAAASNLAATKTIKVTDSAGLSLTSGATLTALTSVDASGTSGAMTMTIDGSKVTYTGSKGVDKVTLTASTVAKNINLGNGNDTLDISAATLSGTFAFDGGAGSNTLVMAAAQAATESAGTTFEAKISNFDKLSLNQVATTAQNKVNLDNMDDIKYVISAGAADTAQIVTVDFTNSDEDGAIANDDTFSLVVNGKTFTHIQSGGASDIKTALAALATLIQADPTIATASYVTGTHILTITGENGAPVIVGTYSATIAGGLETSVIGDPASDIANTKSTLTLDKMLDGGTLELTGAGTGAVVIMKDATGTADSFNIVTGAGANVGTIAVDGVETINFTTTKSKSDTAYLAANKAETVTVKGEGDLDLKLVSTTTEAKLVNAETMKGVLTFTADLADLVVKGGSGKDALTADADDVTLYGGAGDDTLTVKSGLRVNLYGDAGKDTFVIDTGASNTLDAYTVINGVEAGDVIKLTGTTAFSSTKIALSVGADETLLNYANQAIKNLDLNEMGWFQKGGNTYIVKDGHNTSDAFDTTTDMIIMITGLVDLGTGASYNSSNILEII